MFFWKKKKKIVELKNDTHVPEPESLNKKVQDIKDKSENIMDGVEKELDNYMRKSSHKSDT